MKRNETPIRIGLHCLASISPTPSQILSTGARVRPEQGDVGYRDGSKMSGPSSPFEIPLSGAKRNMAEVRSSARRVVRFGQ